LDPERCNLKAGQKARNQWVANHVRQLGHFEDVSSPIINTHEEYMEEDINTSDIVCEDRHATRADLPPSGIGAQPTRATSAGTSTVGNTAAGVTLPTGVTRLRFGTPKLPVFWSARKSPWAAGTAYWGRGYAGREMGFSGLAYHLSSW